MEKYLIATLLVLLPFFASAQTFHSNMKAKVKGEEVLSKENVATTITIDSKNITILESPIGEQPIKIILPILNSKENAYLTVKMAIVILDKSINLYNSSDVSQCVVYMLE